jgi:transcriptional regulator with XRE-family HTH domain
MKRQAILGTAETPPTILGIAQHEHAMPKKRNPHTLNFGARLSELRKAAGFTQEELAESIGMTRRMLAYYEVESEHPPTHLLPAIAAALHLTTDELLGLAPVKKAPKKDSRLQRRLAQLEKLEAPERRQIMQVLDTLIESAQVKRKAKAAA